MKPMEWPLQKNLLKEFGNPSRRQFRAQHIVTIKPPFLMFAGGIPIHEIEINSIAAEDLKAILNEIWIASGKSQKKIHEWGCDRFDGTFVVRAIRGGKAWSTHAFGMAIDLNARGNPLGVKPGKKKGSFTKDHPVVKIFRAHNWIWGGNWRRRPDGMHFQAAII